MNEIANVNTNTEISIEYKEKATQYLRSMGLKLQPKYEAQFIELCSAYGLNPFKREIYAVPYKDGFNIITGYEVYLKRAERLHQLDGWNCEIVGSGKDLSAKITIYRKDWSHPFTHEVYFEEVCQKKYDGSYTQIWGKMPRFMLKKVCIAQGFRLAFPDEFGGMPYTSDELPMEEIQLNDIEIPAEKENKIAPEKKADKVNDNVMYLEQIMNEYHDKLDVQNGKVNPYELCKQAMSSQDENQIITMIERAKSYLEKKYSIKVA